MKASNMISFFALATILSAPLAGCRLTLSEGDDKLEDERQEDEPQSGTSGDSCGNGVACAAGYVCYHNWCVADGKLRISLTFDVDSDFDLHLITPTGDEIFYSNPVADGGELDVDQCVETCGYGDHVENIYFYEYPPEGTYQIYVQNFGPRASGSFTVEINAGVYNRTIIGQLPAYEGANSSIYTFQWPLVAEN